MRTIAYLANQFPSPVEPYVMDEIRELRRRGVRVIPCSARRPPAPLDGDLEQFAREALYLPDLKPRLFLRAICLSLRRRSPVADLWKRILFDGQESLGRRLRAVLHTVLGIYYALLLEGRDIDHIHVHHGYFSSWIAMVAARWLGIGFSMTLHGSDLLLHQAYLDTKLGECRFCITISEYNRRKLQEQCPAARDKIFVQHLGVEIPSVPVIVPPAQPGSLIILAVGRLHRVKDHAFLIRACHILRDHGIPFLCLIAGDGPERKRLRRLITKLKLESNVQLLGHVPHAQLDSYYRMADVVALTSRSEGIPLTLMEAMAHGRIVLAPAINGIPELVLDASTGFLYTPGSLDHFVARMETIYRLRSGLEPIRRAARDHVMSHFDREKNLAGLADLFLTHVWSPNADPLLQQVQLPVQRY